MADDYTTSGDTSGDGSTAVLDAPPASESTSTESSTSVGTTADAPPGDATPEPTSISPVPYERFDDVNQRYQRLKWAETYDPQAVQQRWQLTEWLDRDPQGFHNYLTTQLRNAGYLQQQPPTPHAPQQTAQPDTMPAPDYQYRDEQGNVQQFYSAGRMQQLVGFLENKITQRMAPLEEHIGAQQTTWRAQQDAQRILEDAATWPHFSEFKGQIGAAMAQDRRLSIEGAYRRVVIPEIRNRERQNLLAELKTKTGATTTSPSSAQPAGSEDNSKLSLQQLFAREMRRRGMGS